MTYPLEEQERWFCKEFKKLLPLELKENLIQFSKMMQIHKILQPRMSKDHLTVRR